MRPLRRASAVAPVLALASAVGAAACREARTPIEPAPASCVTASSPSGPATPMTVRGLGSVQSRFTGEVAVRGNLAYTTTWAGIARVPGIPGNAIFVWDVATDIPRLIDSVIVQPDVRTIGDVAISDDGRIMITPAEYMPGRLIVYDLADSRKPREISRFGTDETAPGIHTATLARVGGTLYAFLAVNPAPARPARLVVLSLATPESPVQVYSVAIGQPYVHDTYVRDGLLFLALWDQGMQVWDIGAPGSTASPAEPRHLSSIVTAGGQVHNIVWFHDPVSGSKRYAFIGEEGPGVIGSTSQGDVHVVDLCDIENPREVAFYSVPGAGAHNFALDEARGILYAAFYNGGVRAIDIRGDLGSCSAVERAPDGRCDLRKMGRELSAALTEPTVPVYVWGVEYQDGFVYASDMLNGLWKLRAVLR